MDTTSRIAQAYGYAVCLIAVITILISTASIVNSMFNLSDPLRAEGFGRNTSLTSFAAYKRQQGQPITRPGRPMDSIATAPSNAAAPRTDAELRQAFEDERIDQIGNVRFRSMRTLFTSLLMILVASGLFLMHWRWLRQADHAT